jgi:hypothetical protein
MLCCEVVTEDTIPDNVYPNDIYLNALRLGDTVYGRCDILSQIILNDTKNAVNIHQGYARCSACVIDQNAIITADRSIAGAAGARGVEVTLIESGNIELDGYRYGFIGGASGLFDGCVAFIGDPMTHPSGDKITAAVLNRGMNIIILDDGVLCDCGGLIFI